MAKCLNCGKEVENKFCNNVCRNQYKSKKMRVQYNNEPKLCKNCGKPLPWEKRRNIYCSSSCSAHVNNIGVNRCKLTEDEIIEKFKDTIKVYQCSDEQFKEYIVSFRTWKQLYLNLGYSTPRSSIKKQVLRRCKELGLDLPKQNQRKLVNSTKGDLFKNRKNWQAARSSIRKHAEKVFNSSKEDRKCCLCGYDKHIEIAHIKAVSDFSDETLISEINNIDNLVPLCPNHHWEFDHSCLSQEDIDTINNYKL